MPMVMGVGVESRGRDFEARWGLEMRGGERLGESRVEELAVSIREEPARPGRDGVIFHSDSNF